MGIKLGNEMAREICEILHVDPSNIQRVRVSCELNEVAYVVFERVLTCEEAKSITGLIEQQGAV